MLRIGIVGLSGCGKTSLFRALTGASAEVGVSGKREIHVGQAKVSDVRLDTLTRVFQRGRQVNAVVEYVDVVGFTAGEASRAGFEDQFLGDIRTCDALLHVLRRFAVPGMPEFDSVRDFRIAEQEFLLSDQIILEKRQKRLEKEHQKNPTPETTAEAAIITRCLETLNAEKPLRVLEIGPHDQQFLKAYQPLTAKPQLVVVNVSEDEIQREAETIREHRCGLETPGVEIASACASIEMEIAELDAESAAEFMADLGIESSARDRLVQASYHLLGLISFFTVGDEECRAWTVRKGTTAKEAAGAVHTDMERGFIRAEVVNFDDFQSRGSFAACRDDGVLRLEGKDYPVQDGDIILFRFAV